MAEDQITEKPVKTSTSPLADPQPKPAAPAPTADPAPFAARDTTERRPLGVPQLKLQLPPRKGFVRRFVNDKLDRIQEALDGGYNFIKDRQGRNIERPVGTSPNGGPMKAYAMEIPEELYRADAAMKQAKIDEADRAIMRGQYQAQKGDGRYVPQDGAGESMIRMNVKRG